MWIGLNYNPKDWVGGLFRSRRVHARKLGCIFCLHGVYGLTCAIFFSKIATVFIQVRDHWKPHPLADFTSGGDLEATLHEAFGEILFTKDAAISIHVHLCYE